MAESVDPGTAVRNTPGRSPRRRGPLEWSALLRRESAQGALEDVACSVDPERSVEFVLETPGEGGAALASVPTLREPHRPQVEQTERVAGSPVWLLKARSLARPGLGRGDLRRMALALEAWRAARAERVRAEERLAARTRELDLLQSMGRLVAEASTPDGLFATAAAALHRAFGDEMIVAVHGLSGLPAARAFLARPVAEADLERALRHGCGALGLADSPVSLDVEHLDGFDGAEGTREGVREQDLVLLPVRRRGRLAAALVVLPTGARDERTIRICFSVANQVSLHLDRILTVREAEEDRFRSILDSMPQAVILTDRSLRVLSANPAGTRLLERLSLTSGTVDRIGSLELGSGAAEVLERHHALAGEARLEDGTILDVTVSAVGSESAPGEGSVLVLTDVTERRRLELQLAQAERLSSLGQMISGIAHELNNPLTSVLGYAQLLHAASSADDRLARRLEVVHREARRCQRIVQSLLSFARRHDPERRLLSLNEVVETVLSFMAYQLRVEGVQVRRELAPDLPAVLGDAHQLQQALLNLITNAQHALRAGGTGGTLTVRTGSDRPGWVRLEVEDDGPGVSKKIRQRIFDPFFTTKSPEKGTGLGLSIVYGIVSSHEGSIRLADRQGGGAAFLIELPVGARRPPAGRADGSDSVAVEIPRGRILVVDDEEPVARLICEALAEDGHRTVATHDAGDALRELASDSFDLVICDLRMPGMTVESLREQMDRLRPGLSRRLLLTTGDTVSSEPEHFARREGIPLLHKPFDLDDLRRTVRSWLLANRERPACDT